MLVSCITKTIIIIIITNGNNLFYYFCLEWTEFFKTILQFPTNLGCFPRHPGVYWSSIWSPISMALYIVGMWPVKNKNLSKVFHFYFLQEIQTQFFNNFIAVIKMITPFWCGLHLYNYIIDCFLIHTSSLPFFMQFEEQVESYQKELHEFRLMSCRKVVKNNALFIKVYLIKKRCIFISFVYLQDLWFSIAGFPFNKMQFSAIDCINVTLFFFISNLISSLNILLLLYYC